MVKKSKDLEGESAKKILIMGLDNGGKTSILLCLRGIKNLLSFYSIRPTKGADVVNFKISDSNYNIWDFGGQEAFRKEYLENFNQYISGTRKIIYVIDIQDIERYNIALNYMEDVIKHLQKYDKNVDFSIFLHKFDPDLEQYNKNVNENTIKEIIDLINEKIPPDFNYSIHKTSIYTIFEKSRLF